MNQIISVSAAAVVAAMCCVSLRKQVPEFAAVIGIAGGALIVLMVSSSFEVVSDFLAYLAEKSGLSVEIFAPVLKVTGIAVMTKISGEICRDAQESGLATFLELGGTVLALAVTVPLAKAVINMISDLI